MAKKKAKKKPGRTRPRARIDGARAVPTLEVEHGQRPRYNIDHAGKDTGIQPDKTKRLPETMPHKTKSKSQKKEVARRANMSRPADDKYVKSAKKRVKRIAKSKRRRASPLSGGRNSYISFA